MQKILITVFALLLTASLFAQHEPIQPFEELGIKVKVLTLSNGKYQESFPNDTTFRFGSVMFNRVTGEVVTVIENDTLYGEYNLKPEVVSRWLSPDPLAHEYTNLSPYNYSMNNPVRFIDPDGQQVEDVILKGAAKQEAFNQLQASVKGELTLTMDEGGNVSYTKDGDGKLSKSAKQLTNAIDDGSVYVEVTAENSTTNSEGSLYIGGAFMGNEVAISGELNTMTAKQEVNPGVLGKMSDAHGKPGADMLHEVTEAYQGGLMSQKSGVASPSANQEGSVYPEAHNKATKQSGQVFERIYDASGNEMKMAPGGGYPAGVKSADWYVNDKKGNKVVIQTLK
ncbi:MAG TPA: RHS repeat-associated core domain-containing protein [Saprospiraceae bacterium]|nr:RHS repeat-associated core domain-containing protein [Saprospiraceae bacterium]